ncbi:SAICAR synthetase [Cinnamomum micranthum f. kanehirae]|uniref:glutathione transferase n=1 Tax=Cinnamomum micranthum f. kanehirae TaxID=337451 RepID=A0A443NB69_9MAGN|nr:SAICAR synthetase [Cinnamomum micranthum f. kanehirae]
MHCIAVMAKEEVKVKVIGSFPSLFSYRVQWALKLKGIEFEYFVEDLLNKSPILLKYNPVHKKVPVLVHNGKAISESLVILEYIDETWKENPLLPQDPHERAMARFWAKFADEKVFRTWSSPFALRVIWALKLKGIEHEYCYEDLSNKSPLLLEYNPIHKKVPVLVHNGRPIVESIVILEYIDETWKENPILPEDPYDRAMARFMAKFSDEKCLQAVWRVFTTQGKEREEAIAPALECLKTLEEWLVGKKYFNGETLGFADIVLAWIANLLGVFEEVMELKLVAEERFPLLCAWIENLTNAPVINTIWPPRDKLLAKYHALHEARVKVIGSFPSLFSYRVQWALKLKGIEFEYFVEDLLNKSPILPILLKKVQVLVHNGKAISESLVILEYIDETWKENPLLPQDPHERAMARFWAKFADEKMHCIAVMAKEEVKVFRSWSSPFALRVIWALKLKGIEHEYCYEDLSNKSPQLLEYNPIHKKVPVLVHHGRPIVESIVILEYIDETWKENPILPEDPYDRAMARFMAKFSDEKVSHPCPLLRFCCFIFHENLT